MIYKIIKRLLDLLLAIIGFAFLILPGIIIGTIIKIDSKGPILFKQKRIGMNRNEFNILKFRTMYTNTPPNCPTGLLKNSDAYITKIGRLLRKTSLDELPQIINIIRGDMSFIGPRPVIPTEIELLNLRDVYSANCVRPGLTGWAQINGRDKLSDEVKAKLDGEYVNRISLFFDIKIFFKTIIYVIKRHDIHEGY